MTSLLLMNLSSRGECCAITVNRYTVAVSNLGRSPKRIAATGAAILRDIG